MLMFKLLTVSTGATCLQRLTCTDLLTLGLLAAHGGDCQKHGADSLLWLVVQATHCCAATGVFQYVRASHRVARCHFQTCAWLSEKGLCWTACKHCTLYLLARCLAVLL